MGHTRCDVSLDISIHLTQAFAKRVTLFSLHTCAKSQSLKLGDRLIFK